MMRILVLFVIVSVVVAAKKVVVVENYSGDHTGWLRFHLAHPCTVTSIIWCSELFVPREGEIHADINNCKNNDLMRVQLFPGGSDHNYVINTHTNVIQINPATASGFWLNRQADIVIHGYMDTDPTVMLEHVIRVNHIGHVSNMDVGKDSVQGVPSIGVESATTGEIASIPLEQDVKVTPDHNKYTIGYIVIAIGVCCAVGTIGIVLIRKSSTPQQPQMMLCIDNEYDLDDEDITQPASVTIEMQKEQDNNILLKLGSGANTAFISNQAKHK